LLFPAIAGASLGCCGVSTGLDSDCSRLRDWADCGHYRDDPRGARTDHVASLAMWLILPVVFITIILLLAAR
jgi:hypothetical protein